MPDLPEHYRRGNSHYSRHWKLALTGGSDHFAKIYKELWRTVADFSRTLATLDKGVSDRSMWRDNNNLRVRVREDPENPAT